MIYIYIYIYFFFRLLLVIWVVSPNVQSSPTKFADELKIFNKQYFEQKEQKLLNLLKH
jgi:hypothetical protein